MKKRIEQLLYSVGVTHCYVGFPYFVSAVILAAEDLSRLSNIRKHIYMPLTVTYKTQVHNIERDIRTIRSIIVQNAGIEWLERMAGYHLYRKEDIYPREIIGILANYIIEEKGSH